MADSGVVDFYPDFMGFRGRNLDVFDGQIFPCLPCYGRLSDVSLLALSTVDSGLPHLTRNSLRKIRTSVLEVCSPLNFEALTFPTVSAGMVNSVY